MICCDLTVGIVECDFIYGFYNQYGSCTLLRWEFLLWEFNEIIKFKLYISCRESFAYLITQNNTVADLLWFIYSVLQQELNSVYFEWRNITGDFISRFSFTLLLVRVNMKTKWLYMISQQYGMNHSFSGRPLTSTITVIDNTTGRCTYRSRQNHI